MTGWTMDGHPGATTVAVHRNGVAWHDAPLPRRWHWCRAQTAGWVNLTQIERCSCGAIRDVYHGRWSPWVWKNTRRTARRDATPI